MKPIDIRPNARQLLRGDLDILVVPAPLHDASGAVSGDALCALNTIRSSAVGQEIHVDMIVGSLVRHTAGNGVEGWWCVGVSESVLTAGATAYAGFGKPPQPPGQPVEPDGEFAKDGVTYRTFYFDAMTAR